MKKRLAVTLAAVALSVVMSVPAYAGTRKYVNDQWKYQRGANKFAYKEWIEDNGNWYYMDNNGVMTTGWQQIDGQWYYMDQAGVMQKGWFKDNDKWYFLLPNGAMATNTVIDGRQIGADGVWIAAEGWNRPILQTCPRHIWCRTCWTAFPPRDTISLHRAKHPPASAGIMPSV